MNVQRCVNLDLLNIRRRKANATYGCYYPFLLNQKKDAKYYNQHWHRLISKDIDDLPHD